MNDKEIVDITEIDTIPEEFNFKITPSSGQPLCYLSSLSFPLLPLVSGLSSRCISIFAVLYLASL